MKYRKATAKDALNLFNLKNDLVVRKNAINKEEVGWETHMTWLAKALTDKDTKIWIIVSDEDEFIGDLRIQNDEMSIRLVKEFRGKGLGSKVIKEFSDPGMTAKICEGNIGSMNVFVSNGFRFIYYRKGVYTLKR